MLFSSNFLNDIKSRLTISRVIGEKLSFDKRKSKSARGDYWACCPFHHEKTPSFRCQDARSSYHCFGCGESGDIFSFAMKIEGITFAQAVAKLAETAGLELPKSSVLSVEQERVRVDLYSVLEKASDFFSMQLYEDSHANIRSYLRDRGLIDSVWKKFSLGYAPEDKSALQNHLKTQAINLDQMVAAGLVVKEEENGLVYERFRGRIVFPIKDLRGRVVAFGGRTLSPTIRAKYINSPETKLFHKSQIVYNLLQARNFCRNHAMSDELLASLIIVEGYMDVIALDMAGFGNVVAPLGTALTSEHMLLIWQNSKHPIICFDGDEAGIHAAYRTIDKIMPILNKDVSVRFALLPSGLDPDELVRTKGAAAMRQCLLDSRPLIELLWQREVQGADLDTPEKCANLEHRLTQASNLIQDNSLRGHYLQTIKARLRNLFYTLRKGGRPAAAPNTAQIVLQNAAMQLSKNLFLREKLILSLLLNVPSLWLLHFDQLANLQFTDSALKRLHQFMLELISTHSTALEAVEFQQLLLEKFDAKLLEELVRLIHRIGISLNEGDVNDILSQALHLYRRGHNISAQLEDIAKRLITEDVDLYKTLANIKNLLFEAEKTFIEEL